MRFKQLLKNSDASLKKKLYKSGKNWVIKSTLGLAGGLVLFGFTQSTNVRADVIPNMTPTSQSVAETNSDSQVNATTNVTDTSQSDSKTMVKTTATNNTNDVPVAQSVTDSNTTSSGNSDNTDSPQITNGIVSDNQSVDKNETSNVSDYSQANEVLSASQAVPESAATTTNMTANGNWGTNWNITDDNNGNVVLHIASGTLNNIKGNTNASYDPWLNERRSITKVVFDGPVIAGNSINGLFSQCGNLTEIDGLSNLDTSNTSDMTDVFRACTKLQNIDLSNFNTDKLTDINGMFWGNTSLKSLDVSNLNVSKVQDFGNVFNDDINLTDINISNWDLSRAIDFTDMFNNEIAMTSIELPNTLSSTKVSNKAQINFNGMFGNDRALPKLDLSNLDMSEASETNLSNMLVNDNKISELTLSSKNKLAGSQLGFGYQYNPGGSVVVGWQVLSSADGVVPVGEIKTNDELISMYDGVTDNGSKTTWGWHSENYLNFKVRYIASDDPTKVFYTTNNINLYLPGSTFRPEALNYFVSVPGYEDDVTPQPIVLTKDVDGTTIDVEVAKAPASAPMTIELDSNDTNGKNLGTQSITLPVNDTSLDLNELNKWLDSIPQTKLIPYDASTKVGTYAEMGGQKQYLTADIMAKAGINDTQTLMKQLMDNYVVDGTLNKVYAGISLIMHSVYAPVSTSGSGSGSSSSDYHQTDGVHQTIATYKDSPDVQLYDDNGIPLPAGRKVLIPDSDWYSDEISTINGQKYYRVATGLWAKMNNVYVYYAHDSDVRVNSNKIATLVTAKGDKVTDRELQAGSSWYTDRYIYINNEKYYRVATNEFVSANQVTEY